MKLLWAVLLAAGLMAVSCGGAPATPSPTPRATDAESLLNEWRTNGLTTTCADWNHMTTAAQTALASTMLATIRSLDPPAAKGPASATQVEDFRAALVADCTAGTDCTNPDFFCDTDRITEAAYASYAVGLDEFRR